MLPTLEYESSITKYCSALKEAESTGTEKGRVVSFTTTTTRSTTIYSSSTTVPSEIGASKAGTPITNPTSTRLFGTGLILSSPTDPSETDVSDSEDLDTNGGLSAGAKGGIATGVIIAVLIFLFIGFLLRRRRRKKLLAAEEGIAGQGETSGVAELDAKMALPDIRANATDDPYIAELDAGPPAGWKNARLSELDTTSTLAGSPPSQDQGSTTATPAIATGDGPPPKDNRAIPPETESSSAQQGSHVADTRAGASATTSTVQDALVSDSVEELAQLMKMDEELEERRRTLEDIKQVKELEERQNLAEVT